ncbi:MAG: DUF1275 domain-containing protein [Candidatus Riflebacteria bacterium]|nr:DUF1275 domain-containing protein [Candidatus Riflebacteria bacterium]
MDNNINSNISSVDVPVSVHERFFIYELLVLVAGMMGAYTIILRGGVFCNAQTANIALMGIELGKGNWQSALYYLIPFSAYLLGIIFSEIVPIKMVKLHILKWDTLLILIEIITFLIIGFIPLTFPVQAIQIAINLIASMQYATFKQTHGVSMATVFVANHIRQTGIFLVKAIREKNIEDSKRAQMHLRMILCFLMGAMILATWCNIIKEKTIWLAIPPLTVCFIALLSEDIKINNSLNNN